jgi:succinate--hydroxymethylglutarate CoA-transferase
MTLDFKDPEGHKIVEELVSKSDIFLTNFVPSQISKLKLDYERLSGVNPALIYASV